MARERKFSTSELYEATKELFILHGYDGFTFGDLAEKLNISRGAIYKYFENKDDLFTSYMLFEMNKFFDQLKKIEEFKNFEDKFNYLMDLILNDTKIHSIIQFTRNVSLKKSKKIMSKQQKLDDLHMKMYIYLDKFVQQGKQENILKKSIPNSLILGFIFQTIAIPNHDQIPQEKWKEYIKEIIRNGMFTNLSFDM